MAYTKSNLLERIGKVQEFARQFYEPGRHDRSWYWVWRHHVKREFNISYRTFQTYMQTDVELELEKYADRKKSGKKKFRQLSLFDNEKS